MSLTEDTSALPVVQLSRPKPVGLAYIGVVSCAALLLWITSTVLILLTVNEELHVVVAVAALSLAACCTCVAVVLGLRYSSQVALAAAHRRIIRRLDDLLERSQRTEAALDELSAHLTRIKHEAYAEFAEDFGVRQLRTVPPVGR